MTAPKPLTKGGKVAIWFMIVFIALVGVGGGTALIVEGLDGRDALADGPVGTLTPTGRQCGKDDCSWIGEFVSEDGTITRTGVRLRDAERIRRSDPMPTSIDNVRLHNDAGRPTAYTIDYNPGPKIVGGVFLLVFCLVVAVLLVRMVRRHTRRGPTEPTASGTRPPA
ncbi:MULTISPECIES: hypothetical protein [unclassified Parafrankia]|uniref:hypothetical protein n=1 Tax=unclassified Parafrankia TaxID=2994368 RepID=UPI000DA51DA1|nr:MULTISPECIES: hypothetical protein [unclassified Parafrankia]TCJ32200.1 hypothetical protein E0504_44220 [Parafrankia sp. BMG5.11]SQE00429.1 hypothetical protein FMEAI12_6540004 [Parafrankia sp. Ea1.12]